MVIILKSNPDKKQLDNLLDFISRNGITAHETIGTSRTILSLAGDTSTIDIDALRALDIVEDVKRIQEPYKLANRKFHPNDTVIKVGNTVIGDGSLTLIAGPCTVESEEQIETMQLQECSCIVLFLIFYRLFFANRAIISFRICSLNFDLF